MRGGSTANAAFLKLRSPYTQSCLVQPGDGVDKLGEQHEAIRLIDIRHSAGRKLRRGRDQPLQIAEPV